MERESGSIYYFYIRFIYFLLPLQMLVKQCWCVLRSQHHFSSVIISDFMAHKVKTQIIFLVLNDNKFNSYLYIYFLNEGLTSQVDINMLVRREDCW